MECTFDERKQQLERECVVKPSLFEACLDRLDDFMIPFVQNLYRQEQCDHATKFVSGLCSDLECKNAESKGIVEMMERRHGKSDRIWVIRGARGHTRGARGHTIFFWRG